MLCELVVLTYPLFFLAQRNWTNFGGISRFQERAERFGHVRPSVANQGPETSGRLVRWGEWLQPGYRTLSGMSR